MLKLIGRILQWLQGGALKLLLIAAVILLIWGIISPVGTLQWWVRQGSESLSLGLTENRPQSLLANNTKMRSPQGASVDESSKINCYIVFLPGVGDFSGDELTPGEKVFLDGLVQSHPNCVAVRDVFPYSADNESLGGNRLLAPVWNFAHEAKGRLAIADALIKIRNLWRFAISADPRYGTIYNQGISSVIIERMQAIHPIPGYSAQPLKVILIGTSGGVEVALNTVHYLSQRLDAKMTVVSIGGVFNGRNGFDETDHVYHLRGHRDWVEDIGGIVFPSRWQWNVTSPFIQARLQGRYQSGITGSHNHDGSQGYFGTDPVGTSQATYVGLTLQRVNQLPIWGRE